MSRIACFTPDFMSNDTGKGMETFKVVYSRYVIHNVISSLYRLSIRRNLPLMMQHSLRRVTATLNCSTEHSDQISSSVVSRVARRCAASCPYQVKYYDHWRIWSLVLVAKNVVVLTQIYQIFYKVLFTTFANFSLHFESLFKNVDISDHQFH